MRAMLSQLAEKHFAARPTPVRWPLGVEDAESKQLRDLLSRTLTFAVASLLPARRCWRRGRIAGRGRQAGAQRGGAAEIARAPEAAVLPDRTQERRHGEQQELLLRLFKLLLENVSELLDDDSWLRGQIESVQDLIAGPIDQRALEDATRSLKEVIYKQGQLKHSLSPTSSSPSRT
jgi:diguanylate cyclase